MSVGRMWPLGPCAHLSPRHGQRGYAWRTLAWLLCCLPQCHSLKSVAGTDISVYSTDPTHAAASCISDDFSYLYVMLEADASNAVGPTPDELRAALDLACVRVGGCHDTEREQAMGMLRAAWTPVEWHTRRAAAARKGERVVALGLTYVLDRSLTVAFPGLHNGTHTRLRLSPDQDLDSAVALYCHKLGRPLNDPMCVEAAYYARVGRAQMPQGAWCMDSKDAIHSFTRRMLDQRKPVPSSSDFTGISSLDEFHVALQQAYNITAPSDMTLRGELTWHASLLPPQDKLYGPELPLRVQLHYRPPANTAGGRPVHVLDLSAVAQFLGEPLYVATRLSGCPWSVSTVHPSSSLDTHEAPLLVSCDARPLAVDDVNGRRLVGLQVFESSRLAPLSHLMAVAGKQQRPSPPPPEVAPYRSPALYPPSFAATMTRQQLREDGALIEKALASLVERDRGQEAVQAFRDVYAPGQGTVDVEPGVTLHWPLYDNQHTYMTQLRGCEVLALRQKPLSAFVECMDRLRGTLELYEAEQGPRWTQGPIVRNGILRVADLDQALVAALVAEGRFSGERWRRLKQWAEELVLPTWEVLAVDTYTDKLAFHGYQRFYGPAFATIRSSAVRVMELGSKEGSAGLWPRIFPDGRFVLVDHLFADTCQPCRLGDGIWGHRVDLHDEEQVQRFADSYASSDKQVDVIVDDGSHLPFAQVLAFKHLFEKALKPGGLFVIEDIELSYHTRNHHESLIPHMLSVVDVINREYIDPLLDYPPLGEVAPLVSTISFGQNCIILRKKTEVDEPFNGRLYRMRHRVQNYTVGGYDEEVALRRFIVKNEQPPQHPDLLRDGVGQWSRVEVHATSVV